MGIGGPVVPGGIIGIVTVVIDGATVTVDKGVLPIGWPVNTINIKI